MVDALDLVDLWELLQYQPLVVENGDRPPLVAKALTDSNIEGFGLLLHPPSERSVRLANPFYRCRPDLHLGNRISLERLAQMVGIVAVVTKAGQHSLGPDVDQSRNCSRITCDAGLHPVQGSRQLRVFGGSGSGDLQLDNTRGQQSVGLVGEDLSGLEVYSLIERQVGPDNLLGTQLRILTPLGYLEE